jgi:aspartate racemase
MTDSSPRQTPRTVGILGGMSSASTVEYYRGIDAGINDALGGHDAGDLLIRSVNFGDIERFISTEEWDAAGEYLPDAAQSLEAAGAEFLLMATNTMHKVAPRIESAVSIPFVHIVDVAAEAVLDAGVETVGVLGTQATMAESFYGERLASHGLDVIVPDQAQREAVDEIIFDELTQGIVRDESRERYLEVIDGLTASGAEGIILGCTEIELLVDQSDCPETPLFDTTALHVERAVEWCLAPEFPPKDGG